MLPIRLDVIVDLDYGSAIMSTKISFLTTGLVALGLIWTSRGRAQESDVRARRPDAAAAAAPSKTVHMLSDGRVLKGFLSERDETHYSIRQKFGRFDFPKADLVMSFGSLHDLYRYRLNQFPESDPDEHLKLARWCLKEKMMDEARAELEAVVKYAPKDRIAQAMIEKLDADAERVASNRDADVVRTSLDPASASPPPALDPVAIQAAKRELGVGDVPVIFDLPPPLAVKRAQEFSTIIHPILQNKCASCHNERFNGAFRLIEIRGGRSIRGDELRVNLDATLQLIDPERLEKSDLLTSLLMPHKSLRRSILGGQNDPYYQIISTWVSKLRPQRGAETRRTNAGAGFDPSAGTAQETAAVPARGRGNTPAAGFAADRLPKDARAAVNEGTGLNEADALAAQAEAELPPEPRRRTMPGQILPGSYSGVNPIPPEGTQFPTNQQLAEQIARSYTPKGRALLPEGMYTPGKRIDLGAQGSVAAFPQGAALPPDAGMPRAAVTPPGGMNPRAAAMPRGAAAVPQPTPDFARVPRTDDSDDVIPPPQAIPPRRGSMTPGGRPLNAAPGINPIALPAASDPALRPASIPSAPGGPAASGVPAAPATKAKKPAKKSKIDLNAYQELLMNRNGGRNP